MARMSVAVHEPINPLGKLNSVKVVCQRPASVFAQKLRQLGDVREELSGDCARKRAFPPLAFILILRIQGGRKMRVLVCGGRDFDDAGLMISVLDRLHTEKFFTVLIHGNARGADRIADAWASCRGIPREPYDVPQGEWDEVGKKAAPLRNQRMLDEGKPDLVVAFPGGGGTKDIVRRAVKARVPVHEVNRADDW